MQRTPTSSGPVFLDTTGRRWHHVRRVALGVGIVTTLLGVPLVVGLLFPPLLPAFPTEFRPSRALARLPQFAGSRHERERLSARQRLFAALRQRSRPLRPALLPLHPARSAAKHA